MSTLKKIVSRGTRTTPPPSPVREPSSPAITEPIQTNNVNSRIFIHAPRTAAVSIWHLAFSHYGLVVVPSELDQTTVGCQMLNAKCRLRSASFSRQHAKVFRAADLRRHRLYLPAD